jgi:hypothetical protein
MTHTVIKRYIGWLAGVLLVGLCSAAALGAAPVFVDAFNDSSLNTYWWSPLTSGGPTVQEVNSRVEVTIPSTCTDPFFYAHIQLTQPIVGDFDAQVDYQVLSWPSNNGVRLGLTGVSSGVERVSRSASEPGNDIVCTDVGGVVNYLQSADASGTLRLKRVGSTITGYFLHNGAWVSIGSGAYSADDAYLALSGWSQDDDFGRQAVSFAFDNFQITTGALAPEPATMALLACGAATIMRRRKK